MPILLMFSVYLRITTESLLLATVIARSKAIRKAIREIRKIRADRQVNNILIIQNSLFVLPIL